MFSDDLGGNLKSLPKVNVVLEGRRFLATEYFFHLIERTSCKEEPRIVELWSRESQPSFPICIEMIWWCRHCVLAVLCRRQTLLNLIQTECFRRLLCHVRRALERAIDHLR